MRIQRKTLLETLASVKPGVAKRELRAQTACVIFEGGVATTYNEEVCCRAPSGLDASLRMAVRADKLTDVLEKIPGDEITVTTKNGHFVVKGRAEESGVRMEREITLSTQEIEKPGDWLPLPEEFNAAMEIVPECASTDISQKFNLLCVHLTPRFVEACDNYRLCRHKLHWQLSGDVLVRASALAELPTLRLTNYCEGKKWLHFKNATGLVVSCRRYPEDFPKFGDFLKVNGETITFPATLEDVLKRAEIFSRDNTADNKVTCRLRPGKLTITSTSNNGYFKKDLPSDYQGEDISFRVGPKVLLEIAEKQENCPVYVTHDRIRVDGPDDKWRYVACLTKPRDENNSEEEEDGEANEATAAEH